MRTNTESHEDHKHGTSDEFFVVGMRSDTWYVSTHMARFIEQELENRAWWIVFVDITGARIRVKSTLIDFVCQSTGEQRALSRAFFRSRRKEEEYDCD